jgi:hypothetical protein
VEVLEFRWGVKRFDIITRLRSGELGSNIYDKNNSLSIFVSPSECYPIEKISEFACHLHKHIWPYEEEFKQLKKYAADKYNEHVDRYVGKGLVKFIVKDDSQNKDSDDGAEDNYCSSFDYIRRTDFEGWMSGPDALRLLNIGPSRFIDILNRGLIKTSQEDKRIIYYNKEAKKKSDIWMKDCITYTAEPFFCIGSIEYILINAYDIADALKQHEELSDIVLSDRAPLSLDCWPPLRGDLPDDIHDSISEKSKDCEEIQNRIAELEITNVALQAKIAELETAKGAQETTDQNGKPRTASATEAAQASRVEAWKGYAAVIAKVAYDCGLEDRTQVTRSAYEKLAKRHGGLSKQALELLRSALPEGVTKKTGGPASQG